jgi:hypothetical protein
LRRGEIESMRVVRKVIGRRGREERGTPGGGWSCDALGAVATVRRCERISDMFYYKHQYSVLWKSEGWERGGEPLVRTFCAFDNFPSLMRLRVNCSTTGSYRVFKCTFLPRDLVSGMGNLWPTPASGYERPIIRASSNWARPTISVGFGEGVRSEDGDEDEGGGRSADEDGGSVKRESGRREEVENARVPLGLLLLDCLRISGAFF